MTDPVVIGFGQIKWVKDANTKLVWLSTGNNTVTNTVDDLETADAGSATSVYTVPTGKVFILLAFRAQVYSGSSKEGIYLYERYGGNNYVKGRVPLNQASTDSMLTKPMIETYIKFQAGSTIAVKTYASAMSVMIWALGVETDV